MTPKPSRLLATREQMFALSRHGAEVAERGRPTCQYCGNPMDPGRARVSRDERALLAGLSDPAVAPAHRRGELEILGLLPNSSNYTFLVRATGEDGDQALGVYKPQRGEMPLWDFPEGTLCRREVAAYVVARSLGWPNVPPTILRDGPEGLGSVQTFVDFDPEEHYFTLQERFVDVTSGGRRCSTSSSTTPTARAGTACSATDGRIWVDRPRRLLPRRAQAADGDLGAHGRADPRRRCWWASSGSATPWTRVDRIATSSVALLNDEELLALRRRVGEIVAIPGVPRPGGDRPFPWPPV